MASPLRTVVQRTLLGLALLACVGLGIAVLAVTRPRPRTLVTIKTPADKVESLAFSPDGLFAASGDGDGKIRVWNTEGGTLVASLENEYGADELAFSPDGSKIAAASCHDVRIHTIATGTFSETTILGQGRNVSSVAFSPSGDFIVLGDAEGTVFVLRTADLVVQKLGAPGKDFVNAVALSPRGDQLLSGDGEGAVVRDVATGRQVFELALAHKRVWGVAWSPRGDLLATTDAEGMVRLWRAEDGRELRSWHALAFPGRCAFSPSGELVAVAGNNGLVGVWSTATGELVAKLDVATPGARFHDVAFSPTEPLIGLASDDGIVRFWRGNFGR